MTLDWMSGAARRWGWLLLLALTLAVIFPSARLSPLFLLLPFIFWLQRRGPAGRRLHTPYDLALLLLLLMVLVSTFVTFDLAFSAPKVIGLAFGVVLLYGVAAGAESSPAALKQILLVYALAGLALAAVGLAGTRWAEKLPYIAPLAHFLPSAGVSLPGAESGLQPNEVAGVLLWIVPPALALALAGAAARFGRGFTLVQWSAALAGIAALALTQSRSGYLGAAVALVTVLMLSGRRLRQGTLAALLALAVIAGATFALLGAERSRQVLVGLPPENGFGVNVGELDTRLEIWSRATYAIQDFAWTGMGMNVFRARVADLYPLFLVNPAKDIGHAHNIWLQAALDLGLPGLVAYLAVYLTAGALAISALRRADDPLRRAAAVGVLGGLLGFAGYGMFDAVALGARPGFILWMLFGIAAVLGRPAPLEAPRPA